MANGTTLRCIFTDTTGSDVTFNFKYADPEATRTDINALMTGMITNNSIYENPPAIKKSATLITTEETTIDVS